MAAFEYILTRPQIEIFDLIDNLFISENSF